MWQLARRNQAKGKRTILRLEHYDDNNHRLPRQSKSFTIYAAPGYVEQHVESALRDLKRYEPTTTRVRVQLTERGTNGYIAPGSSRVINVYNSTVPEVYPLIFGICYKLWPPQPFQMNLARVYVDIRLMGYAPDRKAPRDDSRSRSLILHVPAAQEGTVGVYKRLRRALEVLEQRQLGLDEPISAHNGQNEQPAEPVGA